MTFFHVTIMYLKDLFTLRSFSLMAQNRAACFYVYAFHCVLHSIEFTLC